MSRPAHVLLYLILLLLLIGLILLAVTPTSHTPGGVLLLFLFSLFVSAGFLMFGGQRFEKPPQHPRRSA